MAIIAELNNPQLRKAKKAKKARARKAKSKGFGRKPFHRWKNTTFRAQFKAENPDAKPTEVNKAAGEAWKEVSDERKAELKAELKADVIDEHVKHSKEEIDEISERIKAFVDYKG